MDQIRGSLSESWAVTSHQSLTKPDVHTLPSLDTGTHCGSVIVCCPDEARACSLPASEAHAGFAHTIFVCVFAHFFNVNNKRS